MKLRPLQAFRAVAYTGSTTLAASELGISQPAVSSLISSLEREVGFTLFWRRKGRLYLTAEGEYFTREVESALASVDRLIQTAKDIREMRSGELRIACLPGLSTTLMPSVVSEFLQERPQVRVFLETGPSREVEDWIRSQQFDVGLAERTLDDPAIRGDVLSMRCVCVVPQHHRLARKKRVGPSDLESEPFVSLKPDHFTYFHLDNAFATAGARWNVQVVTRLFTTACAVVASSAELVSVVDPISAAQWSLRGVRAIPFEPHIPFHIKILYPAHRARSALVKELIALLSQRIAPFTGDER